MDDSTTCTRNTKRTITAMRKFFHKPLIRLMAPHGSSLVTKASSPISFHHSSMHRTSQLC
ncbi:hypothetical protein M408DRAFT_160466 [Serendipita vermifera MAFF 305830]|uniref:Uncharacterized protein n=1 Tax=Serendipita vermifera MAFF 305830 TaxID=933852 RepID=A0A0C3ATI0_SERVB|nr:hypothetical protein M408DRAFT_160466 [Serendipita vermifera MAFF 305830]